MKIVILENIRSAYNVGNIIRTADALWRNVRLTWYSPSPVDTPKVVKTSLGAENAVGLQQFKSTPEAILAAKKKKCRIIAAEITPDAASLDMYKKSENIAVIFGNEVDGVLESTLKLVDDVVYIPMKGIKESLNVGQTSAIFMWELNSRR